MDVIGLSADGHVSALGDDGGETLAEHGMIFDEQDVDDRFEAVSFHEWYWEFEAARGSTPEYRRLGSAAISTDPSRTPAR